VNLRALRQIGALAVLAVIVAGCASLAPKLETPRLSLKGIRMQEASLFEQRFEVRLRVQNPNDLDLPVRGLDLEFELGGEKFATGVSAREFTVPALGEAEFDMLVTSNAATAILNLIRAGEGRRETIDYRISGKLRTKLGLLRTVPFEEKGTVPLRSIMGAREDTQI
jgi:LEA14-like dessication related protein